MFDVMRVNDERAKVEHTKMVDTIIEETTR